MGARIWDLHLNKDHRMKLLDIRNESVAPNDQLTMNIAHILSFITHSVQTSKDFQVCFIKYTPPDDNTESKYSLLF